MRYIADSAGYVKEVSFGAVITCGDSECVEYTGAVPEGYASIEDWFNACGGELWRWMIVDGNLTLDPSAEAPVEPSTPDELKLLRAVYPVGSIYLSTVGADPGTLFGFGTWERVKDMFLLAAGDTYEAGATGGEATHTLTADEMPKHSHTVNVNTSGTGLSTTNRVYWNSSLGSADKNAWGFGYTSSDLPSGSTGVSAVNTGGDQPHNNMPPYLTVYMWKRTA